MESNFIVQEAKKFGSIALLISILQLIVSACMLYFKIRPLMIFLVLFFYWAIPFLVVYKVEKRDARFLGLILKREKIISYAIYSAIGFILLIVYLIVDFYFRIHFTSASIEDVLSYRRNLVLATIIQITTVGLPEELFFRGYLMTRFCNWLGKAKGLILSSFIFGLLHVITRISQFGLNNTSSAILSGMSSFFVGLILGYQYLKTKSLITPAISHISIDLFGVRIIKKFDFAFSLSQFN